YYFQEWNLGAEIEQVKYTVRIFGTYATTSNPVCGNELYSGTFGDTRSRTVDCPTGYQPNYYTSPTYSYCWAPSNNATGVIPPKNLGHCKDCDLLLGHPVNVATGNKYLEERDYAGSGPFPLEYVRRYNSLAYTASQQLSVGPNFALISSNWRGTYDRAVLLSES